MIAQVHIDDRTNNTPMEMLSKCRQLKMEDKCGLIVVDYLQLMTSHRRTENRQQEISDISRALKVMAKELDVPVIALSQLSRAVESRKESRPLLSDLRESGAIEQTQIPSCLFIVKVIMMKEQNQTTSNERQSAELILAKNRAGATGTVDLEWVPIYTLFIDPSDLDDPGSVYDIPGAIPTTDEIMDHMI